MAAVLITGADSGAARLLSLAGHEVSGEAGDELDVLVINAGAAESFSAALEEVVRVLESHLPALERSSSPVVVVSGADAVAQGVAAVVAAQYARTFPRLRINAVGGGAEVVARAAQVGPEGPSGEFFAAL
ncbi:hypothetical protein [Lentzea sp. NPDC003310]|uniref:hypothetical protein n=1 Tax=Lentzea sp. NPDC003310 TaxID=3154447 RepID=UPI0033BEEA7D